MNNVFMVLSDCLPLLFCFASVENFTLDAMWFGKCVYKSGRYSSHFKSLLCGVELGSVHILSIRAYHVQSWVREVC